MIQSDLLNLLIEIFVYILPSLYKFLSEETEASDVKTFRVDNSAGRDFYKKSSRNVEKTKL